jgi:hypothetical protein
MVMILERDHTRTTFVFDIKFVFIPSILGSDENFKRFLIFQTVSSHLGYKARSQEKIWKRTIQGVSYRIWTSGCSEELQNVIS